MAFDERCEALLVNLHGCALRARSKLSNGTPVQLQVRGNVITGLVVDAVSMGRENDWMVGIALDHPGNFWGIQNPPKDWDAIGEAAPPQASSDPSDEQSEASSSVEKLTIWPSAFGPEAHSAAPSPCASQAASHDSEKDELRATEPTVGTIGYGQSQPQSSKASEAALVHLQSEIEQRAAAEWMRLRTEAEQHVQEARTQLRSELEHGLIDWREERGGVEGKVQELLRIRDQVEGRLNAVADLLRGEIAPVRDQIIDEARQHLGALIGDFQDKAAADSTAREKVAAAASFKLEEMQNACMQLVTQLQRRVDEDQTAREAIRAQVAQILAARTEEESLLQQHRTEQEAAQQAISAEVDRARQARESVESLVHSFPDTIGTQVEEQAQAILAQLRDSLEQDVSTRVRSAFADLEKRLQDMVAEGNELQRQEKHILDATAARMAELEQLEASLRNSARESAASVVVKSEWAVSQMREQLQNVIAEQQERVEQGNKDAVAALHAVAGNLLTSIRHQLLNDLGCEQEQVRQRVQTKIDELLRDGQQTAEAALQERAKQLLGSVHEELLKTFDERQQRFETAHAAATAQLQQLEKRTDELTAIVDVELQAHTEETIHDAVAQITEQLQQAAASVREAHLATAKAELDRGLGVLVGQAGEAAAELRLTSESVQQQTKAGEVASAQFHREVQEAQNWLARETQQFQRTIAEAFLKAGGEIRGRIHQAVEMASEPLECRSREIQAEIAAVARQQSEELQKQLEIARQRLQSLCEDTQAVAESGLRKRATETLDSLRQDARQLAQNSLDRWEAALAETLAAIPQILATKLSAGNGMAERPRDEDCVAQDHPGAGDGGTQRK
ncbi:MAG: hypothetical protein WCC59_01150 [Terriglobales bacterium]